MTSPTLSQRPLAAVTAEGETFASAPKRLKYVSVPAPAPGSSVEIAPGVRWARIPLPMDLNHINVWLVATDDGCVIVDTGMAVQMGKDAWEAIERETFATQPVRAVFVTHIHPDHSGLAAWLQERYRVPGAHVGPHARDDARDERRARADRKPYRSRTSSARTA